jgi:hypothetical protein
VRTVRDAPQRRLGLLAGATVGLLLVPLIAAGPAPAASSCPSPPETFPTSQMHPGMVGTGYTVIKGQTLTPFQVEVLGVMPSYVFLDVDVIAVRITGPQSFIDTTGGAVAGMSGSPVYIGGKLAGAVAWAIAEDREIFGLTAAEDMVPLFSLSGTATTPELPDSVAITPEVRRAIAQVEGTSVAETATSMEAVPFPLGVSSLGGRSLSEIEASFAEHGIPVSAFRAGATSAPTPATLDPTPFVPGDGFGIGLSYGDVSWYGFGTTTAVCGNTAIGFGHPFQGTGATEIGLNEVDVIAIDNGTFWGTKIGLLGDAHGTMTQDRFPGVVGTFGALPGLIPVTSVFSSPDTGLSRNGRTDVAWDQDWFLADVSYSHAWTNITNVMGMASSPGTLHVGWTISGAREDGSDWSVSSATMQYSSWSAADSVWRMVDMIYSLAGNGFENIAFTSVDMNGEATVDNLTSTITQVRTASPLQPKLAERDVLLAEPGDRITIEVTLDPIDGSDVVTRLTYKLPKSASATRQIKLRGGHEGYWYDDEINSFDDLLAAMSGGEQPNDLVATGFGRSLVQEQDVIVSGKSGVYVQIVR